MQELLRVHSATVMLDTPSGPATVLNGVEFSLREGELLALVGRNGSGKSTLLQVIAGLCPMTKGKLHWHDPEVTPDSVSLVFQNPALQMIGDTVLETVGFGLESKGLTEEEITGRVMAALRWLGMEALLHERTAYLSGGQKQLLSVAVALVSEARLMLFDEAASMLDPVSRKRLLNVVQRLRDRGVAIIWATHAMDELLIADRVIAMEDGNIVFDGEPGSFFYGNGDASFASTPCKEVGFSPPYTVSVIQELVSAGAPISEWPVTEQQFWSMVEHLWR